MPVLSVEDALRTLDVTPDGLSDAEAAACLTTYGPNLLATHKVTAFDVLVRQLRNPLLMLLLNAAAVSAATGGDRRRDHRRIVAVSVGLGL